MKTITTKKNYKEQDNLENYEAYDYLEEIPTVRSSEVSDAIVEQVYTSTLSGSTPLKDELNYRNGRGYTALMLAVERENLQVLRALLEAGADLNVSRSSDGRYTALSLAIDKGHTTAVQELLQHGAFLYCEKGIEALDMARENGFLDAVVKGEEILINRNAEITMDGKTGVFQAFKNSRLDLVKDLTKAGSYISLMHKSTYTVLHNNRFLLQQLIDNEIKVNIIFKDKTALILAINFNSLACVDILLKAKFEINLANAKQWTALHFAASRDKQIVKMLIEAGADLNCETYDGETPLYLAACTGNKISDKLAAACGSYARLSKHRYSKMTEYKTKTTKLKDICTYLVEAGANVNVPNKFGAKPIVNVLAFGSLELMKLFIEKGADVNACDSNKNSLLSLAILKKHTEIANLLVATGADVNFLFNEEVPVLTMAVQLGDVELVTNMLARGADVTKTDKNGDTPLHTALRKRDFDNSLEPVLEYGSIGFMKPENYQLFLPTKKHYIEQKPKYELDKKFELVKILIDANSNINQVNNKSESPLHLAVENKLCVESLIKAGADVNLANGNNQTPLHLAASGPANIVDMLIDAGADVNARIKRSLSPKEPRRGGGINLRKTYLPMFPTSEGSTALHVAARNGNINTMKRIVSAGGSVNAVDINGDSVLHKAIGNYDIENITYLIEAGAYINAPNSNRVLPVVDILKLDSVELLKVFIGRGAALTNCDSMGNSLLALALSKKSNKIAVFLAENGEDVNFLYNGHVPLLVEAVQLDDVELVRTMIKHGADVTKTDRDGNTPLQVALLNGNRFKTSLKHQRNRVDEKELFSLSPIHDFDLTPFKSVDENLTKALSHENLSLNAVDSLIKGENTFSYAEIRSLNGSNLQMIELLLKHGAEFDTSTLNDYLLKGPTGYADVFLKYTATPLVEKNVRSLLINNQVRKLESIFSGENFEYLRMLVYNGIVLCTETKRIFVKSISFTSLMLSIKHKCVDVAKYLLANGYMTVEDLRQLRHFDTSSEEKPPLYLTSEFRGLIHEVVSQPWPLFKLAFIAVSTMLGEGPMRDERLSQTNLPPKLKQLFMFQTPVSLLPVTEWHKLKIRFDLPDYKCLPYTRNFWPFDVWYSQLRHKLQILRNYTKNRQKKLSLHHRRHLTEDVLKAAFDLRGRRVRLSKDQIHELEPLVEECINSIDACVYYHGNSFNVDKGPQYLVLRSGLQFMIEDFESLQLEYSEGYSELTENVDFFTERLKNWQESFGTFSFYENVTHRAEDLRKPDGIPDDHTWWFPTDFK